MSDPPESATLALLCDCGEVIDVSGIEPGSEFICPGCRKDSPLEEGDPRLVGPSRRGGGVFDALLRERLESGDGIPAATPVGGTAIGNGRERGTDETTPIPVPGAGATRRPRDTPPTPAALSPADSQATPALAGDGTLAPGGRIGVFRIDRILGRGGMGVVYEAFDTQLQRTVALKVLGSEHVRDGEHVDRFRREARSAASLSHPNITHIYGMGEDHGIYWFAMELVRGRTLAEVIEEDGPLSPEIGLEFLHQVLQGLRAAHTREIIHRDLKPTNLIVSEHGLVKITDFGLAKVQTSSVDITATGIVMGTPLYMSPEQGRGDAVDHRSDIYSLGCTFYHLVTGRPPYGGETAMAVIVGHLTERVPSARLAEEGAGSRLSRLIEKMMQKSVHERFQSYEELQQAVTSARSTTSKLDLGVSGRTILVAEHPDRTSGMDPMSLKQLSVADVNLGLGRHEKALGLYRKVLEDHPELEVDLSFRMLKIHQVSGNDAEEISLYRRILELSDHTAERTYCRWKLLRRLLRNCSTVVGDSREALEGLLSEEIPEEISTRRLSSRLDQMRELEERLREDDEGRLLLIRKSGDLQIELD